MSVKTSRVLFIQKRKKLPTNRNGRVWDLPAIPGMVAERQLTVRPDIRALPQTSKAPVAMAVA